MSIDDRTGPARPWVPTGQLPAYAEPAGADAPPAPEPPAVRERDADLGIVPAALGALSAGVTALSGVPVGDRPSLALLAFAAVAAMVVVLVMMLWISGRRRRPVAERPGLMVLWPTSSGGWFASVVRQPRALALILLPTLVAAVLSGLIARLAPEPGAILVGVMAAGLVAGVARPLALGRRERRTGWVSMRQRDGRGWVDRATYVGDGLVVPLLDQRLGLPRPLAELERSGLEQAGLGPADRWHLYSALGRHAEALALAGAAYRPSVSASMWAGYAAVSALALDRPAEAERWIRRPVDDGYRGRIAPQFVRALVPLHHTEAWKALRRQAG
jgi:hypothetical protein